MSRTAAKKRANPKPTAGKASVASKRVLEKVARGERVVIRRGKKTVAAVVSIEDLRLLEKLEDRLDIEAAQKAEQEALVTGTVSLAELKKQLGDRG